VEPPLAPGVTADHLAACHFPLTPDEVEETLGTRQAA
jgi:hypothetical protein